MDKKTKKTLIIVGAIEAVILIFCLTISIIVLKTWVQNASAAQRVQKAGAFIAWFQNNPTLFFITIVLPVFVIFLVDAIYLIVYSAKKPSALTDEEREAIQAQAREEARKELEAEMKAANETKDEKK
jgi:uncharacterized membrane protein